MLNMHAQDPGFSQPKEKRMFMILCLCDKKTGCYRDGISPGLEQTQRRHQGNDRGEIHWHLQRLSSPCHPVWVLWLRLGRWAGIRRYLGQSNRNRSPKEEPRTHSCALVKPPSTLLVMLEERSRSSWTTLSDAIGSVILLTQNAKIMFALSVCKESVCPFRKTLVTPLKMPWMFLSLIFN